MNNNVVINSVYYVTCNDPNEVVNPIAIRPYIENDKLIWEDTSRGSYCKINEIGVKKLSEAYITPPESFEMKATNGKTYFFKQLTLEIFDDLKKAHRIAGENMLPDFKSDEDLQNYYKETNFYG